MKTLLIAALLCALGTPALAQFVVDQTKEGLQQDAEITYLKDLAVGDKAYFTSYNSLFCTRSDQTIVAFSNAILSKKEDLEYGGGFLLTILPKGEVSVKLVPAEKGHKGDKRELLQSFASSVLRAECDIVGKLGYYDPNEGLPVHDVEGATSYLELKRLLDGEKQ